MKKIVLTVIAVSIVCMFLSGCIHWETEVNYELLHDISQIQSIRVYDEDYSDGAYDYSDPVDPCGDLLGEISSDQFDNFVKELTELPFTESHLIILFPVTYDPNFYYGEYIVKIEYFDGSCELISDWLSRQFRLNERYPNTIRYGVDNEVWMDFLQKWVDIPVVK